MTQRIHATPSRRHARRWLRRLARTIGPGFHPDTDPVDYVGGTGEPILSAGAARQLRIDLDRAARALGEREFERITLAAAYEGLGLRFDPAADRLVALSAQPL